MAMQVPTSADIAPAASPRPSVVAQRAQEQRVADQAAEGAAALAQGLGQQRRQRHREEQQRHEGPGGPAPKRRMTKRLLPQCRLGPELVELSALRSGGLHHVERVDLRRGRHLGRDIGGQRRARHRRAHEALREQRLGPSRS